MKEKILEHRLVAGLLIVAVLAFSAGYLILNRRSTSDPKAAQLPPRWTATPSPTITPSRTAATNPTPSPMFTPTNSPASDSYTNTSATGERMLTGVVFNNGLYADIDVAAFTPLTISAMVPSGVVEGEVRVETSEGASNNLPFETESFWMPDAAGENTAWSTRFSGSITNDTMWDENVLISGDVTVESGVTLTVEAGVTIFFAANSDDQAGGVWVDRAELNIHGSLVAAGTEENPIYFTSNAPSKAEGDWGGIVVGKNGDVALVGCMIQYAKFGVYFLTYAEGTGTLAGDVRNCVIANNLRGIYVSARPDYSAGGTVLADPSITGCLIQDNIEYGLLVHAGTGYGTAKNNTIIRNNVIEGNRTGIFLRGSTWWLGHVDVRAQVTNNTIRDNMEYGILIQSEGSDDNSGSDSNVVPTIENNLLERNGHNIYVYLFPKGSDGIQILKPVIRYNTVRDAARGITVEASEAYGTLAPTISFNVFNGFNGADSYAIDNLTSEEIIATENYWGVMEVEWDAGASSSIINGTVDTTGFLNSGSMPILTRIEPGSGIAGERVTLHGVNFGSRFDYSTATHAEVTPSATLTIKAEVKLELSAIHMMSQTDGWGIHLNEVFITRDGGQTWHEASPPENAAAYVEEFGTRLYFDAVDADHAWLIHAPIPFAGAYGCIAADAQIWYTTDGGQTWAASQPLMHDLAMDCRAAIHMNDTQNGWLSIDGWYTGAGPHTEMRLFQTTDGGKTWEPLEAWCSSADSCSPYIPGWTSEKAFYGQSGWLLENMHECQPCYGNTPAPAYHVTTDGGATWNLRYLPSPTGDPDFYEQYFFCEPYQLNLITDKIIRLQLSCYQYEVNATPGPKDYVYASDDGGLTWITHEMPSSSGRMIFFDKHHGLLLGREMWRTEDVGATWERINTVIWDGQFSFIDPWYGWAIAESEEGEIALVYTTNGAETWKILNPVEVE